ncbi:unnamed protein product [Adineta steineri]|uniref:Endonuclease/exonuclease/phosphatase domain-containing protein n=1 Tax=Adineta steineri TaxID=433720 RepID=A0A814Q4E0_9BILA|nr:unnamed protein product [Adineta steineri]CAF3738192.1 unnamed protein product [Adineta steineri]
MRRPRSYYQNKLPESNMHKTPDFHHQNDNEIDQTSPLPLLVPSFQRHTYPKPTGGSYRQPSIPHHHHLEKHLPHRMWSNTIYQEYFRKDHHQHFKFHIVCYNILAQMLLEDNSFLYQHCFKSNLKWSRRKDRLLRELLRQDADILCLQEMQKNHYENEFQPILKQQGYDSIYVKRTGDKYDGCCLFYRINRLKLIQSKTVSFYQKDIRILDKDNCGLIALFQPLSSNATSDDLFCVATTHLLFSPKRGDIKLAQTQYFLAEIDRFATNHTDINSYYPIILCGDFNAQPQSPLIEFILNRYIKYDTYRCIEISGQTPDSSTKNRFSYPLPSRELLPLTFVTSDCRIPTENSNVSFHTRLEQQSSTILTHNKQFTSVYDAKDCSDVTTNSGDESKLVDFIFYTQPDDDPYRLNLLSRFDLYKQNHMIDIHMPNHQFASDHFLLGAKFALKLRNK